MPQLPNPEVLDGRAVAELLHLPHSTVLEFARRGVIPAHKLGRRWLFLRDEIDAAVRAAPAKRLNRRACRHPDVEPRTRGPHSCCSRSTAPRGKQRVREARVHLEGGGLTARSARAPHVADAGSPRSQGVGAHASSPMLRGSMLVAASTFEGGPRGGGRSRLVRNELHGMAAPPALRASGPSIVHSSAPIRFASAT